MEEEDLVHGGWVLVVVEGGDEDGKGVDMVYTDAELVLQHPRPLITHVQQNLLPPLQ